MYLFFVLSGFVLAQLWRAVRRHAQAVRNGGLLAARAEAAWCVCAALAPGWLAGAPDLAISPMLPALIMALACGIRGPAWLLSAPALLWLGEVSYALYLLHIFVLHPLDQARAACRLVLPPHAADALAACGVLALLLAAAKAAHRLMERPARAWLERSRPRAPMPIGLDSPRART